MEEAMMKIGEVAAFFNVTVKAIRLYEKKGIIKPVKTDPYTGYRYYSPDQVQTLKILLEFKQLGFSLAEIKSILIGGVGKDALAQALQRKRQVWQDAIDVAEMKKEDIDSILDRLSRSGEAVRLQAMTEEQRAWLLAKMVCVESMHGPSALSEALWL